MFRVHHDSHYVIPNRSWQGAMNVEPRKWSYVKYTTESSLASDELKALVSILSAYNRI